MIKRLSLLFIVLMMSIVSVNALTTLTTCGKNSGWVNGETYEIDIDIISDSYANSYCFRMSTPQNNIVFRQISDKIDITKSGTFEMFSFFDGNAGVTEFYDYIDFQDFNVIDSNGIDDKTFIGGGRTYTGLFPYLRYGTYDNITIANFESMFDHYFVTVTANTLNDINVYNTNYLQKFTSGFQTNKFTNNAFTDSFISVRNYMFNYETTNGNTFTNSVINARNEPQHPDDLIPYGLGTNQYLGNSLVTNAYINSILSGWAVTDANDDNTADSDPYSQIQSSRIYIAHGDKYYIQDFNEGLDFGVITGLSNAKLFLMNPLTMTASNSLGMGSMSNVEADFSYSNYDLVGSIFSESQEIFMFTDNFIGCELQRVSEDLASCGLTSSSTTILGQTYNSHISIGRDSQISYTNFDDTSSTGDNRLIANIDANQQSNISIYENEFNLDDFNSDYTATGGQEVIKLKTTSSSIYDNVFSMGGALATNKNMFDIESTNPSSNNIYGNIFTDLRASSIGAMYIFNTNADTNFYNNNLGTEVELTRVADSDLNASPKVYYQHTNGNIYVYNVGNYYADNTGCVDGNSDGICDSPYTSGATTDYYPLASYPFNFEGNILFAEQVITDTTITVTLNNPTDLQSFNLADTSETINISFTQTSQFNDLTCDYIVDGGSVQTITNVQSGVPQSILVNGWTTANHTIRAECLNQLSFGQSTEITIETIIGGTPGNGNETPTNGIVGENEFAIGGEEIFSGGSVTETTDNMVGFFGNLGAFMFNILVPVIMFISILGVIFFIVILIGG